MLSDELLDILACPVCKGRLQSDAAALKLICLPCGLGFPVKDGIPVLLANEAEHIHKPGSVAPCPE